jgi:ABC-2 type transport system permease protein
MAHDLMLRTVALKTARDQGRGLVAWSVGLALLVGMYVAMWPSVRDQPGIGDFLDRMPESFRALFAASGADMTTPVGYVQVELLSFVGPILILLYAVTAGATAIAGEEDRRTMDLLLSGRTGRPRLVLEKAAALAAGVLLLVATTAVAVLGLGVLVDLTVPVRNLLAAMLHLALLGLVFGALALATGAISGRVTAARVVPTTVAVVAYVVNGLGPTVSWLRPLQKYSPFYQYIGHDPLRHGLSVGAVVVAAVTVATLIGVAVAGFQRRDVAG